jgi:small subunit ribosomal protein S6
LKSRGKHDIVDTRDILKILAHELISWARDQKEEIRMNKYELALVVSAKIEDDARTATVEKAKEYITRAGGTVTEVEDWGKKRLAYEVQKMNEGYYYFIQFEAASTVPAAVEQDVRIMDNVLRFLCVRKDEA